MEIAIIKRETTGSGTVILQDIYLVLEIIITTRYNFEILMKFIIRIGRSFCSLDIYFSATYYNNVIIRIHICRSTYIYGK